jgi:hypothetical protein
MIRFCEYFHVEDLETDANLLSGTIARLPNPN